MIKFISIKVREDNLMYFFYNEIKAFSVDSFGYSAIIHALSCEFTKINYTEDEIFSIKPTLKQRKLIYSLTTHNHNDHSGGNEKLKKISPETIIINNKNINEISKISFCNIKPIYTPCHTKCSICYLVDKKYLLTGDFLFKLGCGKFFEGNGVDFLNSCKQIFNNCNDSVLLLYGHDYFKSNYLFAKQFLDINVSNNFFLTLKEEKKYNPFLNYKLAIKNLILQNKVIDIDLNQEYQIIELLRKLKDNFNFIN